MRITEKIEGEGQEWSPIHGDLLEAVFAHTPLVDLARACHVSKSWKYSVLSSLLYFNKLKPWLLIHTYSTRTLNKKTTHAYDPRSNTWVEICDPSNPVQRCGSTVMKSSSSTLLYELLPDSLNFSVDPLHLTWHHVDPPRTWRVDPIVALVGAHIVVAGGASGFIDDPLAVEMYDMETSSWSTCQSMPDILKDSAASTWLSVAANEDTLYVTEKASGITYSFTPATKSWSGPYDLRPDPGVFFSAVGFSGDDLITAGVIGHAQNVKTLKLWKIKPELMEFDQIGEIPEELLKKLKGEEEEDSDLSSISLLATNDFIYIYKSSNPEELIFCEFVDGVWKWGCVKNLVLNDERRIGERMVMSCGRVGIDDLHMAMRSENRNFLVKSTV